MAGLINCKFMPEIIYELQLSDLIMDSLTVGTGSENHHRAPSDEFISTFKLTFPLLE